MASTPALGSQTNPDLQVTGAPPQAQPSGQTITMFAPDGVTVGQIPQENMHAAIAAGGKLAVNFISPEGQQGYIPLDRVHDAIRAGGHINNAVINALTSTSDVPAIGQGFAKAAINTMRGAANTMGGEGMAEKVGIPNVDTEAHGGYEMTGKALETGLELAPAVEPLLEKGGEAVEAVKKAVPSQARAGATMKALSQEIGEHPVTITDDLSEALSRYQELVDNGNTQSTAVKKLLARVTDPDKGALTYDEARDFITKFGEMTADEKTSLTPTMQRQVSQVAKALKDSVAQTADNAGKLEAFIQSNKEYRNAKTIEKVLDWAKDTSAKGIAQKAGAGGALVALKKLLGD